MTTAISISKLKTSPRAAIIASEDYPLAIKSRNKTEAYILGKDLFEKLILLLEDIEDRKIIDKTDFSKGRDFEEFAEELGI